MNPGDLHIGMYWERPHPEARPAYRPHPPNANHDGLPAGTKTTKINQTNHHEDSAHEVHEVLNLEGHRCACAARDESLCEVRGLRSRPFVTRRLRGLRDPVAKRPFVVRSRSPEARNCVE